LTSRTRFLVDPAEHGSTNSFYSLNLVPGLYMVNRAISLKIIKEEKGTFFVEEISKTVEIYIL